MHHYLRYFLLLFSFLLPELGNCQQYPFRHYETEDGLSSNTVNCVLQDSRGFIWMGTANGLNRFDGRNYKIFQKEDKNHRSLGNNYVNALCLDKQGNLWIGTHNGLYLFEDKTETFRLIDFTFGKWVTSIADDGNGTLWLTGTGDLYQYKHQKNKHFRIVIGYAYTVTCNTKGEVFTSDNIGHILKLDKSRRRFIKYDVFSRSPAAITKEVEELYDAGEDKLLIGTSNEGLKLLNLKTGSYTDLTIKGEHRSGIHVNEIIKVRPDEFWIGTNTGLLVYHLKKGTFNRIRRNPLDAHSLSDDHILSLVVDRENGIWLGTKNQGINYYNPGNNSFERYVPPAGTNNLNTTLINDVCADRQGNIWVATPAKGILKLNSAEKRFSRQFFNYSNASALLADGNKLWIGRYAEGVHVVDINTGKLLSKFTRFYDADSTRKGGITCFYKLRNNRLLIGTSRGLYTYNPSKNTTQRIATIAESVSVSAILEDHAGNIWIGSNYSGLRLLKRSLNRSFALDVDFSNHGRYNNTITSICEDKSGNIWFSSESDGITMYNQQKNTYTRYTTDNGLASNNTLKVLSDDFNNIWVSTAAGLCVLQSKTNAIVTFTKADGLLSNQFCANAGFKSPDGTLYFGSTLGLVSFNPAKPNIRTVAPPLFITDIELNNKKLKPDNANLILNKSIVTTQSITLPYHFSNLTLTFAALSYKAPDAIAYMCKMEGLDTSWVRLGNYNKAYYAKLPAGRYQFKVKAISSRNGWEGSNYIYVTITPPWWQTWWAYVAYTITGVAAITTLILYYHQRISEKNKRNLERLETRKDKELYQAKIDFFTNVAHEIRTPLTLITAPLEKLEGATDIEQVKSNVNLIRKNSTRLLQLTNQLLEFRKAEHNAITLSYRKTSINELLLDIFPQYELYAVSQGIATNLNLPDKHVEAYIDVEAFATVMHNLLSNAVKYAAQNISILLFCKNEEQFIIRVSNDGELIPDYKRKKIFEPFYRAGTAANKEGTGIGLALALSLVKLHNGTLKLLDDDTETVFEVAVPLHQDIEFDLHQNALSGSYAQQVRIEPYKSTILLVDDNKDIAHYLNNELEGQFNVLTACNGKEALSMLEAHQVHIVISDVTMPVMDGFQLCDAVKKDVNLSHIPFVLLTAMHSTGAKVTGLQLGADVYIEKPFSPVYLKAQIESLLLNRNKAKQHFLSSPESNIHSIALTKTDDEFITKLNQAILSNINNPNLSVDHLADTLCMTRRSLYRKIQGTSNLSPNEMINILRLKRAAELLATTDIKMFEVAEMVGFKSRTSFTRSFIKQFGMSPTEYLKQR